jgi:hypothetical protein
MTRILLILLGVVEIVIGLVGLTGVIVLVSADNAGMAFVFLPFLAIIALLVVAGVAVLLRRTWSYYLHLGVIPLLGLLYIFLVGPLTGPNGWLWALAQALLVAGSLTAIFLLPAVRRYFGIS